MRRTGPLFAVLILAPALALAWTTRATSPTDAAGQVATGSSGAVVSAVVRFSLSRFRLGVALAGGRVGDNAPLLDIARTAGARCAINGTFFAAYPGETGEPYGTLVINGKLLHLGAFGTRLDVLGDGRVRMIRDRVQIHGTLDDSDAYPNDWYAYNLNQTPSTGTSADIYTPERGATLGFRPALAIIARDGRVVGIVRDEDVAIPTGGFVLALQGKEVEILGWKFRIGQRIDYSAVQDGVPLRTRFTLGAGPTLVRDGVISVDPVAEGFRDPKILVLHGRRSVVGVTRDNEVIFAIIDGATVAEAAAVIRHLGAAEAMNLDDNASSGLVCDGTYLVRPGRNIPNALVLWPDPR